MKHKSTRILFVILLIVVGIALIIGLFVAARLLHPASVSPLPQPDTTMVATTDQPATFSIVSTDNPRIYKNKDLRFSFTIPEGYNIQAADNGEGGRSVSITFAKKINDNIADSIFTSLNVGDAQNSYSNQSDLEKSYEKKTPLIIDKKSIKTDGIGGKIYELGGFASGYEAISTNGKLSFKMYAYPADDSKFIEQVLSTFYWQ